MEDIMSKKFVCLAAIFVTLAVAGSAGAQVGKGKVLFEYWDGISGTAVSNLTSHPNYPDKPSSSEWRDNFQSPSGRADNYGVRARAYLTPPATGEYTFWVAGDDECQLWLSTDDTAANAKLISRVPGWTGVAEWGKYPEQKSAPIALVAGKSYYIEGLMKEGGGGDSLDVGWAGPGIGNATVVLAGQYCTAFIRNPEPLFKATKPDPANGAKEVTNPLFQWTAGATAILHEVYVGTTSTLGPANFMGPWPMNMYFHVPGLTPGVTYYWRVDEVDAAGVKIIGDVWSFTVAPLEAHDPDPSDGMMGRALNVQLKWTPGQGAMKHKVFLSTDKAAVTAGDAKVLAGEPTAASFSPAGLVGSTTYYWRVDEVDSMGKVVAGPVWSFATVDPTGGAVAEYWNGANLAFYNFNTLGAPVVVKTVPNVDFSWPSGTVKGTNSPDAAIDVDYFAGRFTARLDVPVSGKYRLIESTDDGGRLFLNGVEIAGMWATGGEAEFASAELDLVAGERYLLVLE
ncbi:MAG: hypothetical protein FJ280_24330, partial [Planctomycetes bacterium]|nr:hypothetical protein [Planctomycetota bacterium]